MRSIFIITGIILMIFASCKENNKSDVSPSGKIPILTQYEFIDCSAHRNQNGREYEMDTLFYQTQNDSLYLVLNFFTNCGFDFEDSLSYRTDTVDIYVDISGYGTTGCLCDFEFNYCFTDYGDNVQFNVFTRYVDFDETDYTFWKGLTYP